MNFELIAVRVIFLAWLLLMPDDLSAEESKACEDGPREVTRSS
jgi:hypothetical protein